MPCQYGSQCCVSAFKLESACGSFSWRLLASIRRQVTSQILFYNLLCAQIPNLSEYLHMFLVVSPYYLQQNDVYLDMNRHLQQKRYYWDYTSHCIWSKHVEHWRHIQIASVLNRNWVCRLFKLIHASTLLEVLDVRYNCEWEEVQRDLDGKIQRGPDGKCLSWERPEMPPSLRVFRTDITLENGIPEAASLPNLKFLEFHLPEQTGLMQVTSNLVFICCSVLVSAAQSWYTLAHDGRGGLCLVKRKVLIISKSMIAWHF